MKKNIAMKRGILLLLMSVVCVCFTSVQAQATRKIQGVVKLSDEAIAESSVIGSFTCYVYSFYNKEDVEKNLKDFKEHKIKANGVSPADYKDVKRVQVTVDQAGFAIEAVNEGYIVVLVSKDGYEVKPDRRYVTKNMTPPTFEVVKKKVKAKTGDMTQDVQEIENVDVVAKRKRGSGVTGRTMEEDGMLLLRIDDLPYPCRCRSNSRIIIQPYWLDGPDLGENKVFAWADPVVYDYNEYDRTQIRRMDFNKEKNDKLAPFLINDTARTRIEFKDDTIHLKNYVDTLSGHNPDESYPYPARAIIAVEDYNERYVLDTIPIDEGERTNYIKFLDFTYEKDLDVNLSDFKEEMEIRPVDSNGEVKLNFEVGKATLNPKDTTNTRILENARGELQDAFRQSSSKLKTMQVFGYSSPEGNPQSNEDLARRRADFVLNEIKSAIPYSMLRFIRPSSSEILGWDVVADSLERDGLIEEAKQVREIVAKYPGSLSNQGQAVARLSSYAPVIKPIYLPKLRTVRYTYTKVEDRTLSSEELIQIFNEGGDSIFTRAHYYHLISTYWDSRKEPTTRIRLEQIAKRALANTRLTKNDIEDEDSLYNEGYWALAANILATSYIGRDTFDLDILRPFINRSIVEDSAGNKCFAEPLRQNIVNRDYKEDTIGFKKFTNYPELIAGQMIMLLMDPSRKNMEELGQLTDMIENDPICASSTTYSNMLALANCKRGNFRAHKNCSAERASQVRAVVSNISTTNSVIMNIAMADMNDPNCGETSRKALEDQIYELPETSIGYYLRAIIELLRRPSPDVEQAAEYLAESFIQDVRKMPIAHNDQQLIYNRKKVSVTAFNKWEELVKKEVIQRKFDKEAYDALGIDTAEAKKLIQQGAFETMIADCWVETTNKNHPYHWYEEAVNNRSTAEDSVLVNYLNRCISLDPNYLEVIHVAVASDHELQGKANERVRRLFENFYRNEKSRREEE